MHLLVWMLGALCSFCAMAVAARELSGQIHTFETLFFRSAIGLVLVTGLILSSGDRSLFRLQHGRLHLLRNCAHFAGQYGWFVGIGLLPLAEVFALEFTVPIWTVVLAALFLKESITWRKLAAIALGFTGVLLIVKPGYQVIDSASLIVLAAALGYAIAHSCTKHLAKSQSALTILFFMCLVQLPLGLGLALTQWRWPNAAQYAWLTVVGVSALSGHFCMTKAMRHAEVTTVVTLDFLRLPAIALVGVLFYQESFELSLILGGLLMLTGNLINFYRR